MIQENKELLLKDLCSRQPYNVFLYNKKYEEENTIWKLDTKADVTLVIEDGWLPYLRSMSSMTEEEKKEYEHIAPGIKVENGVRIPNVNQIDWLNAHHFDFSNLIEKGLALEAPDGMYDIKDK